MSKKETDPAADAPIGTFSDDNTSDNLLLYDTKDFIRRFCVFPDEHCLNAVTLWAVHAHMVEHFYTTPRLAILSPELGSGKTRVLDVLELLVPEPMLSISASQAAIFRSLDKVQHTLLFDELDTIFRGSGKNDGNEDLRALLNAGYKRGATIPRCTPPRYEVSHFNVFAAVALAGIGDLPETIMSRSVIIPMRRRTRGEKVEQFRSRFLEPEGHMLRDRLADWALEVGESVGAAVPEMPDGVEDRPAEVWEPLLAVADAAGGNWPAWGRTACQHLIKAAQDTKVSLGVRLLGDLRIIFRDAEQYSTAYLIDMLTSAHSGLDDDAPWGELYGKPIDARKLAELLRPYGIRSRKLRIGEGTQRGYRRGDLYDAWQRYLPSPAEAEQVEQAEHVPAVPDVPDLRGRVPH